MNYRRILPRLSLFLVSRRMHDEAYPVFYGQPMCLFPYNGRFFHTKKPLLARLPTRYREAVNTMELRLGQGWSAPPKCQTTENPALGLEDCTKLRILKIFVECDPSEDFFAGFRGKNATEDTYKDFCVNLLDGIFEKVPSLETVEIDAWPHIKKEAPLVVAVERRVREESKRLALVWGPSGDWNKEDEPVELGIEMAMASMSLATTVPRLVEAKA
jgi:hypothetical protein